MDKYVPGGGKSDNGKVYGSSGCRDGSPDVE